MLTEKQKSLLQYIKNVPEWHSGLIYEQLAALNRMATAIEVMATKQTSQAEKIDEIKESVDGLTTKVETIEQKPAKRWDGIVDKIIYGIVGAFVTALGAGIIHLLTVTA